MKKKLFRKEKKRNMDTEWTYHSEFYFGVLIHSWAE